MNSEERGSFEYPDEAGYPDGMGTLNEGAAETADPEAVEPRSAEEGGGTEDGAEEGGGTENGAEDGGGTKEGADETSTGEL